MVFIFERRLSLRPYYLYYKLCDEGHLQFALFFLWQITSFIISMSVRISNSRYRMYRSTLGFTLSIWRDSPSFSANRLFTWNRSFLFFLIHRHWFLESQPKLRKVNLSPPCHITLCRLLWWASSVLYSSGYVLYRFGYKTFTFGIWIILGQLGTTLGQWCLCWNVTTNILFLLIAVMWTV